MKKKLGVEDLDHTDVQVYKPLVNFTLMVLLVQAVADEELVLPPLSSQ